MRDRLNDALQEVIRSPVGFTCTALVALEQLNRLLECTFSVLTFQNPEVGPGFTIVYPETFPLSAYKPGFERYIEQHPHRRFYRENTIEGAVQFTDIISRAELERLDLYAEFFKPLAIRHMVAQSYPADGLEGRGLKLPSKGIYNYSRVFSNLGRSVFSMAAGRDTRAFGREDCELFHRFCSSVCLLFQREMRMEAALRGMGEPKRVEPITEEEPVPPHLDAVIGGSSLTPAQGRVLRWLAVGKTNSEIAIILGNSERTIEVHVEAILKKLKVENRVAAAYTVWSGALP